MSDVEQDRWMRTIKINAGLDKIARGESNDEVIKEVFEELTRRFHTRDMIEFLARTRRLTDWLNDAYKVVNSARLGNYQVDDRRLDRRQKGVISFNKNGAGISFDYEWKDGVEKEIEDLGRMAAVMLGGRELSEMALRGEGMFRERFCQRDYTLKNTWLEKKELVSVAPFGLFLFSYNKSSRERIYICPQA